MNAYELADELERLYQQDCIDGVADLSMTESAHMLRQQADRIAELEKFTKAILKKGGYPYEQSEPVAWVIQHEDYGFGNISLYKEELQEQIDECTKNVPHWNHGTLIPLYTTPQTKPLSDEEITEIFRFSDVASNYYRDTEKFAIEFARAIEAKVRGEK